MYMYMYVVYIHTNFHQAKAITMHPTLSIHISSSSDQGLIMHNQTLTTITHVHVRNSVIVSSLNYGLRDKHRQRDGIMLIQYFTHIRASFKEVATCTRQ